MESLVVVFMLNKVKVGNAQPIKISVSAHFFVPLASGIKHKDLLKQALHNYSIFFIVSCTLFHSLQNEAMNAPPSHGVRKKQKGFLPLYG